MKKNEQDMEQIRNLFHETLDKKLYQMIISNSKDREKITKVRIRPIIIRDKLMFQETAYIGNQVFHENYEKERLIGRLLEYLEIDFRQCEIETMEIKATVLVSKKGKITISKKKTSNKSNEIDMSHDRTKKYILEEGRPVPFLIDLGVQTAEGKIIRAKYDKFKQINRFLEFIEDILPKLPKERTLNIIDFGCGKSYLTFAIYYYLKELHGLDVRITGLDLKKEVIRHCNELAVKYDYGGLNFQQGDISSYAGEDAVDMVVTLHACDTATDHALAKAVRWNASVILSVPCCQHEVNKQISCKELNPILKFGLLKERMSALITDAVRANVLEENGYDVQILEFIDMEHTPKNILIRAVKRKNGIKDKTDVSEMTELLHVETTLQKLLW